jgi:hypothetical protein
MSHLKKKNPIFNFFINKQQDALITQNLFCYKALHVSGIFSAHHQEFSTIHSALVSFMQVLMTASKQSQDGTAVIKTCIKLTSAECTVETPDDEQRRCPKHVEFYNRINLE